MNPRTKWTALVPGVVMALSGLAGPAAGQTWEGSLGWVVIDHDPPPSITRSGEQIPPGPGLALRYAWPSGPFVGLELSRGSEDREGAICGGFIVDPEAQCVPETVGYSGGVLGVSAGWRFRMELGSEWWLGLRPKAGLGTVWVREAGRDTGRSYSQTPLTLMAGLVVEGARRLPATGMTLIASLGVDHFRPMGLDTCEDCRRVLDEPLPGIRMGLGLAW